MARGKYKWRIAGFIFKTICMVFIAGMVALLIWRIVDSSHDPKEMNTIIANDALCEAYDKSGGKLNTYYQEQSKFTRREDNYGYFSVTQAVFIEEADQLQFVLRYNNSTIKYTKEDYSLTELPDRSYDLYDITVTVMYDLTPDNQDDNDGTVKDAVSFKRFTPSSIKPHQKTLYNYRKCVFDGIDITDDVLAVYVDIYYVGDVNYEKEAYGTLLLYYYEDENIPYKLTVDDKKAIESFN